MIKKKGRETLNGLMKMNIKVYGKMIKFMEREL